ncbi:hypothetical protein, partial [Arsukibacterium sp.]|uniref:hypothetical protein n=1 Tax=Arsukibacterium sp. TaxID=1977258 RepID=UPI002FDA64F7
SCFLLLANSLNLFASDWDAANDPFTSNGCKATANFLIAAGAFKVGSYYVTNATAAGLAGVALIAPTDALTETCTASLTDYIRYWQGRGNISQEQYLDTYCGGDAFRCSDPLLDIRCSLDPYANGCNPLPYECHSFGNCLPYITQLGTQPLSVMDLVSALSMIEMSFHQGYWNTYQLNQLGISFELP